MCAEQSAPPQSEWFGQTSKKWVTNRSHIDTQCNKDTIGDKVFSGTLTYIYIFLKSSSRKTR